MDFNFKAHSSTAAAQTKLKSLHFAQGGFTNTHLALDSGRNMFGISSNGARAVSEGVPRVAIVITDGMSTNSAYTAANAVKLRASNVNVFAIGLGKYFRSNEKAKAELAAIASSPTSDHMYQLDTIASIKTIVTKMAAVTCSESAAIDAGSTVTAEVECGETSYFKPVCKVLTKKMIVDVSDLTGSTSVYVSTDEKNPGPFEYTWKDESSGIKHLIITAGDANSNVYVGVLGTACVCDAADDVSEFTIDVYNDLYGVDDQSAAVKEAQPVGTTVYTVPTPATIAGIKDLGLRYSIKNVGEGPSAIPFTIDQRTGVVKTKAVLDCESNQLVWNLHIDAAATSTSANPDLEKCLRGGINLQVTISCGLYCGCGKRITAERNPSCQTCAFGQYQIAPKHRNTACVRQSSCGQGNYYSAKSNCSKSSCVNCPDASQYQPSSGTYTTRCTFQPVCGLGQYYTVAQTYITRGFCSDCPKLTYQDSKNHRTTSCKVQPTCNQGEYITAYSDEKLQTCQACAEDYFQSKSQHRIKACNAQAACGAGTGYSASLIAPRTCTACNPRNNKYQDLQSHKSACKTATACTKMQYESRAPTATTNRYCSAIINCKKGYYESAAPTLTSNRVCALISTCSVGQYVSKQPTPTSDLVCSSCGANSYQDATSHRSDTCKTQTLCGAGTSISEDSKTKARTCAACSDKSYQDSASHRSASCKIQQSCGAGTYYSATLKAARTCTNCAEETFQSATSHQNSKCADAATCSGTQYETTAPTRTTDRVCAGATSCNSKTQYESTPQTETSNRVCSAISTCSTGQYVSTAATATADLVCSACGSNLYQNADNHRESSCKAQTLCGAGKLASADSKTAARSCKDCGSLTYHNAGAGAKGIAAKAFTTAAPVKVDSVRVLQSRGCKDEVRGMLAAYLLQ